MLSHTIDGRKVRMHRELRGMSVVQLADAVGVTPDYLYKIEQRRKQPAAACAKRLADKLEVALKELLLDNAPGNAAESDPAPAPPSGHATTSCIAGTRTPRTGERAVAVPERA